MLSSEANLKILFYLHFISILAKFINWKYKNTEFNLTCKSFDCKVYRCVESVSRYLTWMGFSVMSVHLAALFERLTAS